MNRPRIVLVDDYEAIHEIYRKLLGPDVDVVAAVVNSEAVLDAVKALCPDLIVLDVSIGVTNGFSFARWLKQHMPGIKIVFLTMHTEAAYITEAARIGADGYVLKRNAAAELLQAVRTALSGMTYFPALQTTPAQ